MQKEKNLKECRKRRKRILRKKRETSKNVKKEKN